MTREVLLRQTLQDHLRDLVIKDRDPALWGHLAPLGQLQVTPVPWGLPKPDGANWQYSCPGASDSLAAALARHAAELRRRFDVC